MVLTLIWVYAVLYVTLLGRTSFDAKVMPSLMPFAQMAAVLEGANPEILRTAFMNWLLFFPGGLCTSQFFPGHRLLLRVSAAGMIFSLLIETVQWQTARGYMETDDILVNTLGMLAGGWVGLQVRRLVSKKCNEENAGDLSG